MTREASSGARLAVPAAGLAPPAAYAADPVLGGLLGLTLLVYLPAAAVALYLLRPLVPAILVLPLVLALSCAAAFLAALALLLGWYPAGTALAAPLALAGGCSAMVLTLRELACRPRLSEMLAGALAAGGACLALLLGVGCIRGPGAWLAGHVPPAEWLDVAVPRSAGWSTLLSLGLLIGLVRAATPRQNA